MKNIAKFVFFITSLAMFNLVYAAFPSNSQIQYQRADFVNCSGTWINGNFNWTPFLGATNHIDIFPQAENATICTNYKYLKFEVSCANTHGNHASTFGCNDKEVRYRQPLTGSCPANSTLSGSSCTCNTSHPHQRFSASTSSYSCSQTTSAQEDRAIALIAANLGLSLSAATGLFTSFAACIASVICAAGLAVAGLGTLLFGISFTYGDSTNAPAPTPATTLEVTFADESTLPRNDSALLDGGGGVKAPANSSAESLGIKTYQTSDGTNVLINESESSIFSSRTNPDGSISSTLVTNTPDGAIILSSTSSPYGTAPDGSVVNQNTLTQNTTPITKNTTSEPPRRTETSYSNNGQSSPNPPSGTTPYNGGGSGSGEGEGEEAGKGGGDCDKEPQKCLLLTNIRDALQGKGTNGAAVLTSLNNSSENILDAYQTQANEMLNDFFETDLWAQDFLDALSDTPNPYSYLGGKRGNCSLPLDIYGSTYDLNICPYMESIHAAMTFGFFILLIFGIKDLMLEKETN